MNFKTNLFVGVAALACVIATGASAQDLAGAQPADTNFARDRNTSVLQRSRPGYEAIGLRVGGFMAWPKLTATVEHNDNIYATAAKTDDTIYHIAPEIALTSNWSRHALSVFAKGAIHRYSDFKDENTEDWSVGADSRIDVQRNTSIRLGANTGRLTEPRSSASAPAAARSPIEYNLSGANVGVSHEFNRLRLSARYDWQQFDYKDVLTGAGANIDQDFRDRDTNTIMGRAEYAISPDTAIFLQASANKREYRLAAVAPAVTRDSKGVEVLGGANFDIGALMRGEIGVGYMKQNYDAPSLPTADGVGARATVEWFPTELATVTLTGSRTIEESAIPGSSGYINTALSAKVDYEVLRNLLLGVEGTYGRDKYDGVNIAAARAFDRTDKRKGASVSATYLLNDNVGVSVFYNYVKQTSSGLDRLFDYSVNKVGAKLTLQY